VFTSVLVLAMSLCPMKARIFNLDLSKIVFYIIILLGA